MKNKLILSIVLALMFMTQSRAQQASMLMNSDPQIAKNKKLVYDFWRNVFEGGHLDEAPKYMAENYIQHKIKTLY